MCSPVISMILFGCPLFTCAETYTTADKAFQGFLAISESGCSNLKQLIEKYEAQGEAGNADAVRGSAGNVCECIPGQIKKIRSTLPDEELQKKISESEFLKKYKPTIIDKCAADQLRLTFSEGCSKRFEKAKSNSKAYCECMTFFVNQLSDSEIAQIGIDSSKQLPMAAEAQKNNLPPPEPPPLLKQFNSRESYCSNIPFQSDDL